VRGVNVVPTTAGSGRVVLEGDDDVKCETRLIRVMAMSDPAPNEMSIIGDGVRRCEGSAEDEDIDGH
jgi:hypothetical protein